MVAKVENMITGAPSLHALPDRDPAAAIAERWQTIIPVGLLPSSRWGFPRRFRLPRREAPAPERQHPPVRHHRDQFHGSVASAAMLVDGCLNPHLSGAMALMA